MRNHLGELCLFGDTQEVIGEIACAAQTTRSLDFASIGPKYSLTTQQNALQLEMRVAGVPISMNWVCERVTIGEGSSGTNGDHRRAARFLSQRGTKQQRMQI